MKKIKHCLFTLLFILVSPGAFAEEKFDIKDYEIMLSCHPAYANPYHIEKVRIYTRRSGLPYTNLPVFVMSLAYIDDPYNEIIGEDSEDVSDYGYAAYRSEKVGFDLQTDGDGIRKYKQLIRHDTNPILKTPMQCDLIGS